MAAPAGSSLLSQGAHPRCILWDVTATKANIVSNYSSTYQTFVDNTNLLLNDDPAAAGASAKAWAAVNLAFVYQTHAPGSFTYTNNGGSNTATDYADKAIDFLAAVIAADAHYGIYAQDGGLGYPLAYDWVADRMTNTERADWITWFRSKDEVSPSMITDDKLNSQKVVKRALISMMALNAKNDAGITGANATWVDARLADRDVSGEQWWRGDDSTGALRQIIGGTAGETAQGVTYDYDYSWSMWWPYEECYRTAMKDPATTALASRTAHYDDTEVLPFKPTMHDMIYRLTPYALAGSGPGSKNYQWMRGVYQAGMDDTLSDGGGWQSMALWAKHTYNGIDNNVAGLAQWMETNRFGVPAANSPYYWPVGFVIGLGASAITGTSPDDLSLPTSKLYDSGRFLVKTDWTNIEAPLYGMFRSKWMGTYQESTAHFNGHVFIERKGMALGVHGSANSGHNVGPIGARNQMHFVDRSVLTPPSGQDNHGGPRTVFRSGDCASVPCYTSDFTTGSEFDFFGTNGIRTATSTGGRSSDYAYADLTRTYDIAGTFSVTSGYNPARITFYGRRMIAFKPSSNANPVQMVVFDNWANANTSKFVPTATWNPPGTTVACSGGSSAAGYPDYFSQGTSRNSSTHGGTTYSGATSCTWDFNQSSRSGTVRMGFYGPTARYVAVVGGANETGFNFATPAGGHTTYSMEASDLYGNRDCTGSSSATAICSFDNEFEQYALASVQGHYAGSVRLEVSPQTINSADYTLTSIQAGDLSFTPSTETAITATADFVGVVIGSNIAVFALGNAPAKTTTVGFTIPTGAATYTMTIDGLAASTAMTVTCSACSALATKEGDSPFTSDAAGTLEFTITTTATNAVIDVD